MNKPAEKLVRFDDALQVVIEFVRAKLGGSDVPLLIVRDLQGRVRIAVDNRQGTAEFLLPDKRENLAKELHVRLGAFSPGQRSIFMLASDMFDARVVFENHDALPVALEGFAPSLRLLERSVMGADWLREPFPVEPHAPRVTFFGLKGGVGRSTAAAVWAWRLAEAGRRVLVLDLDLESPGLSSTLLSSENHPDYGIVDWLVEDVVGQSDERLLQQMIARSPLSQNSEGEIRIIPAGGRLSENYSYLPKLARAYSGMEGQEFGDRLVRFVEQAEAHAKPDVTFIDSRAGLHDIAAVAVTRLRAQCLLFAANTQQTWDGYGLLFAEWREHYERARLFRENLKIVAAQVPETNVDDYLKDFRLKAYDLFWKNLYEQTAAGSLDTFNYDMNDPEAPHSPLRINWSRAAQQFDPVRHPESLTEPQIHAAFGQFVADANLMTFGEQPR